MGKESTIEWTDSTINFWHGCQKVSEGCKYCYMYRDKARYNQDPKIIVRAKDETFFKALKWDEPKKIFTCSWSDFFIKEADKWREDAWDVIRKTPQHTWMILTKRPERILKHLPPDWGRGWDHVWIGVSIEDQKKANYRIPKLWEVPAKVRFLSVEPLLEKINLAPFFQVEVAPKEWVNPIHWVIVGGESGNDSGEYKYRPCAIDWIHEVIKQCKTFEIPVFMKQLGTGLAKQYALKDRVGSKFDEQQFPQYVKFREFPSILENM